MPKSIFIHNLFTLLLAFGIVASGAYTCLVSRLSGAATVSDVQVHADEAPGRFAAAPDVRLKYGELDSAPVPRFTNESAGFGHRVMRVAVADRAYLAVLPRAMDDRDWSDRLFMLHTMVLLI